MARLGESLHRRRSRLLAGLAAVFVVPLLAGAGGPEGKRQAEPARAPVSVEDQAGTARPSVDRSTDVRVLVPAESLVPAAPAPPPRVDQSGRITNLPPPGRERALPVPVLRATDPTWTARRLEIPALGVDVSVAMAGSTADELFPPYGGAYILRSSSQPGRGTNSYLFAHAMPELFKPLWWAQLGQQVIVTMSDGQQLGYRIAAVVRDIPCPDPRAHKPAGLPPVLANATECDLSWTYPTATERLTMQTSQGFNRNYGEMVVIAEPEWGG